MSLWRQRRRQPVLLRGKATKKERGPGNDHPTVKPLDLMKYLLTLLSTPDGGVILDPFAGSGTTLLAAQQLGRRCIGIELTEHNCEIAMSRLRKIACRLNVRSSQEHPAARAFACPSCWNGRMAASISGTAKSARRPAMG